MDDTRAPGVSRSDFMARMSADMALATKVKSAMQRKDLRAGWTKCPHCGGRVNAVLVGPRDHIRMVCVTPGCVRLME